MKTLKRFWEWYEAEKPDEETLDLMVDKNVSGLGNQAIVLASDHIHRRVGKWSNVGMQRAWEHPEALRNLSLALCEALERMHELVPPATPLLDAKMRAEGLDPDTGEPPIAVCAECNQAWRHADTCSHVREGVTLTPAHYEAIPNQLAVPRDTCEEPAPTPLCAECNRSWGSHADTCSHAPRTLDESKAAVRRCAHSRTLHVDASKMCLEDWNALRGLKDTCIEIEGVPAWGNGAYVKRCVLMPLIEDGCTVAHHDWPWE